MIGQPTLSQGRNGCISLCSKTCSNFHSANPQLNITTSYCVMFEGPQVIPQMGGYMTACHLHYLELRQSSPPHCETGAEPPSPRCQIFATLIGHRKIVGHYKNLRLQLKLNSKRNAWCLIAVGDPHCCFLSKDGK